MYFCEKKTRFSNGLRILFITQSIGFLQPICTEFKKYQVQLALDQLFIKKNVSEIVEYSPILLKHEIGNYFSCNEHDSGKISISILPKKLINNLAITFQNKLTLFSTSTHEIRANLIPFIFI